MSDVANLYRPAFWSNPRQVHQLFSEMRRDKPIYRCSSQGYPDLWHVTRHADVMAIENAPEIFLSAPRMRIKALALEDAVREITGGRPYMTHSLNVMDAAEHQAMRAVVQQHFTAVRIKQLKSRVVKEAQTSLSEMREAGGGLDFAAQIAFQYPLRVMMPLLGVPKADYQFILKLTKQLFSPGDPDNKRPGVDLHTNPAQATQAIHQDFHDYFRNLLHERQKNPRSDLMSEIIAAVPRVACMDDEKAIHYCVLLATAGHDTTSYSLSEAIYHLAKKSVLLACLADDLERVPVKLAEEAFRLAAPTRHFIRTASQDITLSGIRFLAGDSIVLWFPSACRDELVCSDPDELNIDRSYKVPQSAFGSGPHVCLGMHLARLELACFLEEFGKQIQSVELAADPSYTESNFVGGIKSLPLHCSYR